MIISADIILAFVGGVYVGGVLGHLLYETRLVKP